MVLKLLRSNMKKYIIFSLLFVNLGFGQYLGDINIGLPNVESPKPSVASLGTFAEIPVDNYSGIPSVQIPITEFQLSKDNVISLGLSYHLSNTSFNQKSSETGDAWSLLGQGVISRTVVYAPDEGIPGRLNQRYDDTYSLNLPNGNSALFMIKSDSNFNPVEVIYSKNDNEIKINFEFNSQTKAITKFTVFDAQGYKYIFDIKDVNVAMFESSNQISPLMIVNKVWTSYVSSFHISKIIDNNNIELANFTYSTTTTQDTRPLNTSLYNVVNKLTEINIPRKGKVVLEYSYNPDYDDTVRDYSINHSYQYLLDPYQINQIKIFNSNNVLQNIVSLNYEFKNYIVKNYQDGHFTNTSNYLRRYLEGVTFKNSNNISHSFEKFTYYDLIDFPEYNPSDYYLLKNIYGYINIHENCDIPDWYNEFSRVENNPSIKKSNQLGALKTRRTSLGGGVLFEYEPNDFSADFGSLSGNDITDEQYFKLNNENKQYELIYQTNFNTANTTNYFFNVSGVSNVNDNRIFFKFSSNPLTIPTWVDPNNVPPSESHVVFTLYDSAQPTNGLIHDFSNQEVGNDINIEQNCVGRGLLRLLPQDYRINVSTFMNLNTTGTIQVFREKPAQVLKRRLNGSGVRIKKIKYFKNLQFISNTSSTEPVKFTEFDYNKFDDVKKSSGIFLFGYHERNGSFVKSQTCYENVKVTSFNGELGYSKLTYKVPNGMINSFVNNVRVFEFIDNYKSGNLLQSETFNGNFEKVSQVNHQYQMINTHQDINVFYDVYSSLYPLFTKPSISQLINKTTKNYFYPNGSSTPNIVETLETYAYNPINKKISESTVSNSRGETLTTKYFYHTGNSIHSQNRISEIERIETYRASELLSKSQIIYNNNWTNNVSFLPQTIQTAKGSEGYENRLQYLNYDEFGNPLEVKQEGGMTICYIWGYNKTQPVAKIENITYGAIPSTRIQAIENATNEASLITALNALRNDTALSNAMITTYTYIPLVGISTVTDLKGDKQTYHYDGFNRLEFVKDAQGNILSENQYHYRTQN